MTTDAPGEAPALGPFLELVRERIEGLSKEDLQAILLRQARRLSADDRTAFLETLRGSIFDDELPSGHLDALDPTLLDDVMTFIAQLGGVPAEEAILDADDVLNSDGEDAWVSPLDDLFERAANVYLGGSRALAAEVLGHLLHAFRRETGFEGAENPEDRVATDVPEAKARFLRALYEVTPAAERARKLVSEMAALQWVGARRIGLSDIQDADVEPLPGLDEFLPAWLAALSDADTAGAFGWEAERRRLVREATLLDGGVEALGRLAQLEGEYHAEAYEEWAVRLLEEGQFDEAVSAARDALQTIRDGQERARVADFLAEMGRRRGDADLALFGRREAWRTAPTPTRMVAYASANRPPIPTLIERMAAEAEAIGLGERRVYDRLAAQVELLASAYDRALTRLDGSAPLGWSRDRHPSAVVVPFLLVAGSGRAFPRPDTQMAVIWSGMNETGTGAEVNERSILGELGSGDLARSQPLRPLPLYTDLLSGVLAAAPPSAEQRERFLERARSLIERRIQAVVLGKHRRSYVSASMYLVAWVEAEILAGRADSSLDFLQSLRQAHARYGGFRSELDAVVETSHLIGDVAAERART